MKKISSLQNPIVKQISKLQEKASERRKQKAFIVEGVRELSLAIKGGYQIEMLVFCPEIYTNQDLPISTETIECVEVSKAVYQKIAYRKSTEGIIAKLKSKSLSLEELSLGNNPLILVAEGIEKPGNVGALLRTADAANVDAVFLAEPQCDVYNPNVIRSSVGCVFTNSIVVGNSPELIDYLKNINCCIYAATLQNSNEYTRENYTNATAIAVGSEAHGLSEDWRKASQKNINIPMAGVIDSMNVSVSAAILIFEAKRQRNNI